MATMTDIARECGVSLSTVSLVISGKGRISGITRNRILNTMNRLGYDSETKRVVFQPVKTNTIGLVLPRPVSAHEGFYYRAVLTAMPRCLEYGYDCKILTQQELKVRAVDYYYKGKENLGCDGILLFCPNADWEETVNNLRSWNVPVAIIRRSMNEAGVISLSDDDEQGGRLAGEHLADLGHRTIATVMRRAGMGTAEVRLRGLEAVLRERGVAREPMPRLYMHDDGSLPLDDIKRLLDGPDPVTALFVVGDDKAAQTVRELSRAGIRVPTRISVLGYDDDPEAMSGFPTITTVKIPVEEMVTAACRALARWSSEDETIASALTFKNELIVRESTLSKADPALPFELHRTGN